jgi:formylglycine-generating enzyme required for sulfatase activity
VVVILPFCLLSKAVALSVWGGNNCPVESVSWDDIQTFITKLNAMRQGTYALPTEAQWEYAARASSTTAFANGGITELYCGYDANLDAMGWYC